MSLTLLFNHLLNFLAPALFMAAVMALWGHFFTKKTGFELDLTKQLAINCIAGVMAMVFGLMLFQNDGKMLGYAALVLVCGTSQWVGQGLWPAIKARRLGKKSPTGP